MRCAVPLHLLLLPGPVCTARLPSEAAAPCAFDRPLANRPAPRRPAGAGDRLDEVRRSGRRHLPAAPRGQSDGEEGEGEEADGGEEEEGACGVWSGGV